MAAQPAVRLRRRNEPSHRLAGLVVLFELVVLVGGLILVFGPRAGGVGGGGPLPTTPSIDPGTPSPSWSPRPTPTAPPATPSPTPLPPTPTPLPTPPATPTPAPTQPGPPDCTYADVLTEHHAYGEWSITLLDTIYRLPSAYAPGDLAGTSVAGLGGGYQVRSLILADLRAMADAARAAGAPIQVASAYRSYERQVTTFEHWVTLVGYERALRASARAGHSEHQLGTTLDFTSYGGRAPWDYADWATTTAGAWMQANAWRFGFVMSYPRDAESETCYQYEPWHYRYVGRELAAAIRGSGLTPREVLWGLQ
jgi:D-alanyl-D-alanine carboxypeptidase